MQSKLNGHKFSIGSLHARLKGLSIPSRRAPESQNTIVAHDTIDPLPHIPRTILDLPAELILSICDHLPVDNHACLALACHQLYYYIGSDVFKTLNTTRFELAAFLQKLQKDRPSCDLWLCYGCLRFHSTAHRYDPPNFRALSRKEMSGFPYCRSTYAKAVDEMYLLLNTPWTQESEQLHWMEDDITSPVHMSVYISSISNATDVILRCRYRFNRNWKYDDIKPWMLHALGASNLGICPHVVFARDWWQGDRSIMSALWEQQGEDFVIEDSCHVFECVECQLDVEVKQQRSNMDLVVTVWRYVGKRPPPPNTDCNDKSASNSRHTKNSKGPRPELKSLPPLKSLPSSKAKKFVLPKGLRSRLESLKKRGPGAEAEQPEGEHEQSKPVVLLPGRGEMQRRWESLEMEARESSVGVKYTALTVLEDVDDETWDRFIITPIQL